MEGNYQTIGEFITGFRTRVGDTTCSIPESSILRWINIALNRFARSRGLDKLFKYQDAFELASMNKDGSAASSWVLKGFTVDDKTESPRLGTIIDIKSMLLLATEDCNVHSVNPCFMPYMYFRRAFPMPERNEKGSPCNFTINQMGGDTKIIFDRPIDNYYTIDMVYTAFHPRVTKTTDILSIPYSYVDILEEAVLILYNQEAADMATARSIYEDWDFFVSEARELLAKMPESFGARVVRGSF